MPQAISIDNFIDPHRSSSAVVLCGKLGITQAILEAERRSTLYFDERQQQTSEFEHNKVQATWYKETPARAIWRADSGIRD
jgi:hypothetical protein